MKTAAPFPQRPDRPIAHPARRAAPAAPAAPPSSRRRPPPPQPGFLAARAAPPPRRHRRSSRRGLARWLGLLLLLPTLLLGEDRVFLKNGRQAECRVLDFTAEALRITYQPSPSTSPAERLVPLGDVDYVELAPLPGEPEALAQAVREGRSEPLMGFWVKRLPWLGRPRSNGGEIGLKYAELLTRISTPDRLERALKIYQQIEAADWCEERRGRAQAGRLRLLLRQGRIAEVRPQAEALLERSGDCRVLIELRHVMAEAAAAALAEMERDHPQWTQEDDLVPQHQQLLNEALDGYLYPHLFHGAEEDLAARGLWAAAQLDRAQKIPGSVADWAADLTKLYAGTPEAAAAQAWLDQQPAAPPAAHSKTAKTTPPPAQAEDGAESEASPSAQDAAPPLPKPRGSKSKSKPKSKSEPKSEPKNARALAEEDHRNE